MSALTQPITGKAALVPTLAEILQSDPDEFVAKHTDIAAINLACAVGLPKAEGLDIPRCLRALDAMALWTKWKTGNSWHLFDRVPRDFQRSENAFRVYIMLHHLHKRFGVRYNPERIDRKNDDPTDSGDVFIHGILSERRTGTCASLPVFAVAVGRRIGYPFKLVRVPRHFICRWHDASEEFNIEFRGDSASIIADEEYHKWPVVWDAKIHGEHEQGLWLRSLSPRQEVSICIHDRALLLYYADRDLPEALACIDAAERFDPARAIFYDILRGAIEEKIAVCRVLLTATLSPGQPVQLCGAQESARLLALGNLAIGDRPRACAKPPRGDGRAAVPDAPPVAAAALAHARRTTNGKGRTPPRREQTNRAGAPFTVSVSGTPITHMSFRIDAPTKKEDKR